MKQMSYLFLILFVTTSIFYTSCKKDDDTPEQKYFTFILNAGTGYISGDVTLNTGEQFKVGILANSATGQTLTRLLVTRIFNGKPDQVFDTTLTDIQINYDYHSITNNEVGVETWQFTIYQSAGDSISHQFNITTETVAGPINTYDQVTLGAQINTIGHAFSSSDGSIYLLPNAKANSAKVDFLYYFSFDHFATLASPDDDGAAHVYLDGGTYVSPGPNALLNWPIRNATRMKKITDTIDWDAIVDDTRLIELTQGAVASQEFELDKANYVAFITAAGKKGLIRVNGIFQEDDGTIDLSVKIQQ
jgi:hypothetical protein